MTELLIDKQRVVLPRDLSMQVIEENPFFTKSGTYTLDVTLSLAEDENAKVYQHINRINIVDNIGVDKETGKPLNRPALLIVDNEVVLNGTEIITDYSDTSVTIQLVSGNSELNFLIGSDKKLRNMDLGSAEPYISDDWRTTARMVYDDLNKVYPERNWILAPYTAGYDTNIYGSDKSILKIGNQFSIQNHPQMPGIPETEQGQPQYEATFSGQIPQPYLCFIIRRILEALGYTLEYNALEDDPVRKQAYIVHGYYTLQFAKMLPDWTVLEFFEELETWLDAVTIVDPYKKTVRIEFNYKATISTTKTDLEKLDEYTVEIEEDNNIRIQTANAAYDLDSDDYYMYMDIGTYIRNNVKKWEPDYSSLLSLMERIEDTSIVDNYEYIFNVFSSFHVGEFIAFKQDNINSLKKVDSFKPLLRNKDSEDIDITLKIVPASFVSVVIETAPSTTTEVTSDFWVQLPVAEDYDSLLTDGGTNTYPGDDSVSVAISNIQEAIEEAATEETDDKGGTRLRLALYNGMKFLTRKRLGGTNPIIFTALYPLPFVESLYEDYTESKEERYVTINNGRYNPFRLEEMYNDIYSKFESINTSKTYKLLFTDPGKIDIMSKFIASNKAFRCAKIERTITIDGFSEIVKGDFYPYNNANN